MVAADVYRGGRLHDELKECLRRRLCIKVCTVKSDFSHSFFKFVLILVLSGLSASFPIAVHCGALPIGANRPREILKKSYCNLKTAPLDVPKTSNGGTEN